MIAAMSPLALRWPPSLRTGTPGMARRAGRATRGLAAALAVVLASVSVPAPAQVRIPALGDSASDDLSVGAERRYGEQIMRELRRDPAYLDDPVLLEYMQSLWDPLVKAAQKRGDIGADTQTQFAWEVFLVLDRSVNAFALPGGYVGIHLGLISLTGSSDELASVLAHELSHVTQRHIARSMGSAGRQGAIGVVAMILGILAASRSSNPDLAQAAIVGGQAAVMQGQLNFSRDMEREADRIGWGVFADAGYAPAGMARMFEKMDNASRLFDSGAYPYLRSHPLTVERVADARSRVTFSTQPWVPPEQQVMVHALMQARARVLMEDGVDGWRRLADSSSASPLRAEQWGAHYASALASIKLGDHARAQKALALMAPSSAAQGALSPGVPPAVLRLVMLLQAEAQLAAGRSAQAVATLTEWASQSPASGLAGSRAETLLRAQAVEQAFQAGRLPAEALRESAGRLQVWVAEHRGDAAAWLVLARHHDLLGSRLRALRAQAEARAIQGDLTAAIDLLRAAQSVSRRAAGADFIEASVVDARLRDLERQRRQWMAEMRSRGGAGQRRDDPRDDPREDPRNDSRNDSRNDPRDDRREGPATTPSP